VQNCQFCEFSVIQEPVLPFPELPAEPSSSIESFLCLKKKSANTFVAPFGCVLVFMYVLSYHGNLTLIILTIKYNIYYGGT